MDWQTAWQTAAALPRPQGEIDIASALTWVHEHGPASLSGDDRIVIAEALVLRSKTPAVAGPTGITAPPAPPQPPVQSPTSSSDREVRAGIQQAKVGETGLKILSGEALLAALIIGVREKSWAEGIFVLLGLMFLFLVTAKSEKFGTVVSFCIGLVWAMVAFIVMTSAQAGAGANWAVAILAGLIGAGAHLTGFQHLRDIRKAKG